VDNSNRQKAIDSVRELAALKGDQVSVSDYLAWQHTHKKAKLPSATQLYLIFGTFQALLDAAGVEAGTDRRD
jgi:hypothetical protein